jgi:hypothetical protein
MVVSNNVVSNANPNKKKNKVKNKKAFTKIYIRFFFCETFHGCCPFSQTRLARAEARGEEVNTPLSLAREVDVLSFRLPS